MDQQHISVKRFIVRDAVYNAEISEFLKRQLKGCGLSHIKREVNNDEILITIYAQKARDVFGENQRRLNELKLMLCQRFKLLPRHLKLHVDRVKDRGFSSAIQAESLCTKLVAQLPIRRAAMGIIRSVMESGAQGCEIYVSGKIRGQRAKCMKFRDGYMVKSGRVHKMCVSESMRHALLPQGILGLRVKIMYMKRENMPDFVEVVPRKAPDAKKEEKM